MHMSPTQIIENNGYSYVNNLNIIQLSIYLSMYVSHVLDGPGQGISTASKTTDGPRVSPLGDHMTRKDDKGDQPSGGETT